jgi:hypothetical protein
MPYTTYGLLKAIRAHEIDSPSVAVSVETGRPNACNQCHLDRSLGWAGERLTQWYGAPEVELAPEEHSVAASTLGVLRGDAGQRALWAWSMGWQPALDASGNDWQAPFLALLLYDPYDAVRYVAKRSLGRLPGYDDFDFDFVAPAVERLAASRRATAMWREQAAAPRSAQARATILMDAVGRFDVPAASHWADQRDSRRMTLSE